MRNILTQIILLYPNNKKLRNYLTKVHELFEYTSCIEAEINKEKND